MPGSQDLLEGFQALEDAVPDYREALDYYQGTMLERFANARIQALVQGSGEYRFRLAARPVKVMAARTQIAAVSSDRQEATTRIETIREANDMAIQEAHLMRQAFIFGDAYALVWPVDQDEPAPVRDGELTDTPADQELRDAGVEITYQSPLSCRIMYDAEDGRRPRYAIRRWQEAGPLGKHWRAELLYQDRVEEWITREPGSKGKDPEDWEEYAEDSAGDRVPVTPVNWPLEHDWGEIPVKHARTDLPYGRPIHADAFGPQDAINKILITQLTGVEAYGWPDRYRLLDDQAVLDQARDAVPWTDNEEALATDTDPQRGTAPRTDRRGGGQEHIYTGTKAVGEYAQPDPRAMIDPVDQYVRLLATASEVSLVEFDPRGLGDLSGVAYDRADAPTRARERDLKRYLESFWREIWTLALRMDGTEPGAIQILWQPPEVISDPEWWATAQVRLAMGVPIRQILQEANYLPDQIQEWLDTQGEEAALDQRIARLTALGQALQAIGAAQALGTVSPDQVAGMVERIMGEAA